MVHLPTWGLWKRYLLSFVFVSTIPIILVIVLFYIPVQNLLRDEFIKSTSAKAIQIRDTLDLKTAEIYSLSIQMAADKRINDFLYRKLPLDSGAIYSGKEVSDALRSYKAGNNLVSFWAIYFPQNSSVVTPEGKYSADYFFENVVKYREIDTAAFTGMLVKAHFNEYLPLHEIRGKYTVNGHYITYLHSLPVGEEKSLATILMLIDERTLLSLSGQGKPDHYEQMIILTKGGEIITFQQQDPHQAQRLKELLADGMKTGKDSFMLHLTKDSQTMVSFAKSDINGWNYFILLKMDTILEKVKSIRNMAIFIALLSFITAVVLSVFMTKYNYMPWKYLVGYIRSVSSKSFHNNEGVKNEYLYARDAFENILVKNEQMQICMDRSKAYLRNYLLQNLWAGKSIPAETLKNNGIVFPYPAYSAVVADMDTAAGISLSMPRFAAKFINLHLHSCKAYAIEDEKGRVCIVLNTLPCSHEFLMEQVRHVQQLLRAHFGASLYVGTGNLYESMERLYASCIEARKSLEYAFFKEKDPVVAFPEIENIIFTLPRLPIDSENPLLNSLRSGDHKACSRLLDDFFGSIAGAGSVSIQYMYCLFYNFVTIALKACKEIHADIEQVCHQRAEQFLDIGRYRNSLEMLGNIHSMYMAICDHVQESKKGLSSDLKDRIEQLIREQYTDNNFSLVEAADELGYSASYLSRFMKQQLGMGFGDLVNKVRLEAAKSLLAGSTYQINEISEKTGYGSINSFIRTFKRLEGITPGRYREMESLKTHAGRS